MFFKDIIGQEEVKKRLIQSVRDNRISHAQLFLGPEGSGNLALALAYAQYILCSSKTDNDSCGQCPSCLKASKFIHPDLHFTFPIVVKKSDGKNICSDYLPEWRETLLGNPYMSLFHWLSTIDEDKNKQGNIPIAECHSIIKKLNLKSFESEYRILVMWRPEFLGKEGNALLKILEEPTAGTLFLLVAEKPDQIINTVLSRTQLIKIKKLSDREVTESLITNETLPAQTAEQIAAMSDGNYYEALQLASEEKENNFEKDFLEWMRRCYAIKKSFKEQFSWVEEFARIGKEKQKAFLDYGLHIVRQCLMVNYAPEQLIRMNAKERESYKKFVQFIHLDNGEELMKALSDASYNIERNANIKILFMDLSFKINSLLHVKAGHVNA